jgi:hypothetical protein
MRFDNWRNAACFVNGWRELRLTVPMEAGLRRADDGVWIVGWFQTRPDLGFAIVFGLIVLLLGLCVVRGGRALAIVAGLVAFPFMYVASPYSSAWQDGRYGSYLIPFLALAIATGTFEGVRRIRAPRIIAELIISAVVVVALLLTIVGLRQVVHLAPSSYVVNWGNPDSPTMGAISRLEAAGIKTGYADYWVAYKLDFLSRGQLHITTAGFDADRSQAINTVVQRSPRPVWLFVPAAEATRDGTQFSAPSVARGPDAMPEATFLGILSRLGVGYRVIDAGILQAVVPSRALTPYEVGMPGAHPDP